MTVRTASVSSGNQVYLPKEILEQARVPAGGRFIVRVRGGIIELVPEHLAEEAMDAGLENIKRAAMGHLTALWDNPDDDAWDEA